MKALLSAIVFASAVTSSSAVAHSFCKILKDGPAFDGQAVRFKSRYFFSPYDLGGNFGSNACKGTIEDITESGKGDASVRQFQRTLADVLPKEFTIEVTGIFHWKKRWQPPAILSAVVKPGPHGQLEVTHVWNFLEIGR